MSIPSYKEDYYQSHCGVKDYFHNVEIMKFFDSVAMSIVNSIAPRTVLDVGCACGHLGRSLRKLGVEAYGVDYSEDALNAAHESIRPYLGRMMLPDRNLPDSFPRHYDLVVNIEVLEHMEQKMALESIKTLVSFGDTVLFSSTPWDTDEVTHLNLHPVSYWSLAFMREGYYPNLDFIPGYLSPQAVLFRKDHAGKTFNWEKSMDAIAMIQRQAHNKFDKLLEAANERLSIIQQQQQALNAKDKLIAEQQQLFDVLKPEIAGINNRLCSILGEIGSLKTDRTELERVGSLMAELYRRNKADREGAEARNLALARELDCQQKLCALQEKTLREQLEKKNELERITNSRSYRLSLKIKKLYHLFVR